MVLLEHYELDFLVYPKEKQFVGLCKRLERVVVEDIS